MAAEDRVAQYLIGFGGDDSGLDTFLAGVKSRFRSAVTDIERTTGQVDLFAQITDNVPKVRAALASATDAAAFYAAQIEKLKASGGKVTDDLVKGLDASLKSAKAASAELARQTDAANTLGIKLRAAGVDTTNLAAAQAKLAESLRAASAAAAQQSAKDLLGFKSLADVTPKIKELQTAFDTLKASGKLSATELAAAQQLLQQRVAAVRAEVSANGQTFAANAVEAKSFFTGMIAPALAAVAAVGGLTAAISSAVAVARTFNQRVAEIGTVTNLTDEQLKQLGSTVEVVARRLGLDVNEALKATYELLRSGVPPDNVVSVLEVSAKAAKAALTDTATGAKAASVLLDAFGVSVQDLGPALDVVVNAARNGGPTLGEFAANASAVGNAARATGQDLNSVLAILQVMTDKSNDAAGSAALLAKILFNLGNPEVVQKLRAIGIETTNVAEILQQLDAKGLKVNDFLDLGVASGKAAASLSALTNNAKDLPAALEAAAKAAGTVDAANAKLAATAAERAKRLSAEYDTLKRTLGDTFGAGGTLSAGVSALLKGFNELDPALKQNFIDTGNVSGALGAAVVSMLGFSKASEQAKDDTTALSVAAKDAADALAAKAKQVETAQENLARLSGKLQKSVKAIQDAAARDIADINARATSAIAELDRSLAATADTAAKTLEIQKTAAQERLGVVTKTEAEITKTTDAAIAARIAGAKKAGETEKDVANDVARIRIAALAPVLAQYQAHYDQQIAIAQASLAKAQTIELARIDIAKAIEKSLRDIQTQGLSDYEQYLAQRKRIEELIAEARQKASLGEINESKALFGEAITLANGLKTVVSANGVQLVTESQRRYDAIAALKKIGDAANESLGDQGKAAQRGADETLKALEPVKAKITELRTAIDDAKATAEEGVLLKVETDEASVAAAQRVIDDLARDRTVTITVQTVQGNNAGGFIGAFQKGGYAERPDVQGFATGGPVFSRPLWSKVPGVGNGDTVPALLEEGSFVVRKSSSQKYGDEYMRSVAQGYAIGGSVNHIGDIASRILTGGNGSLISQIVGLGAAGTGGNELQKLKVKAWEELLPIIDLARQLPQSGSEDDVAEYLTRVLSLINDSSDLAKAQSLLSTVEPYLDQYRAGIEEAMRYHVPYVVRHEKAEQVPKKLAGGGPAGTDTVPAMLTPGEWVIPRARAAALGSDFLHALNAGRLNLGGFAAPSPPVPHFATGGPVPGASIPSRGMDAGRGAPLIGEINLHGTPADFASPENFRRFFAPALDDALRRAGKKLQIA